MVSRGFQVRILIRVIILVVLVVFLAFVLANSNWFFTPLVTTVLIVASVLELLKYLNRYHKNLNDFLLTLKQSGYNTRFPEQGNEIYQTFNEIIEEFEKLGGEKESQLQFFHTLTENLKVGLICFDDSGLVTWMNPEAKIYVGKPILKQYDDLEQINPPLHSVFQQVGPGKSNLVRLKVGDRETDVSILKRSIIIQKKLLNIYLLQNIQEEMDFKEVEAWQKLIRVMRHEIMNSMTPIVGLTEAVNNVLTNKRNWDSTNVEEYNDVLDSLDAVESRTKRLLKFVNAYKDITQPPEIIKEPFVLKELVNGIHSLLEKELSQKKVYVTIDIKPEDTLINGDKKLIEGILINLIKNSAEAIENRKGQISIRSRKDPENHVHIEITDNGKGIEKELLDKVFVPFFTTKVEGSGIGLSLSRQLVHLHGGNIAVDSKPGTGTTFHIFL